MVGKWSKALEQYCHNAPASISSSPISVGDRSHGVPVVVRFNLAPRFSETGDVFLLQKSAEGSALSRRITTNISGNHDHRASPVESGPLVQCGGVHPVR